MIIDKSCVRIVNVLLYIYSWTCVELGVLFFALFCRRFNSPLDTQFWALVIKGAASGWHRRF